jgi:hypothetical protein
MDSNFIQYMHIFAIFAPVQICWQSSTKLTRLCRNNAYTLYLRTNMHATNGF